MNSQMAKLVFALAVIASYGVHGVFARQTSGET